MSTSNESNVAICQLESGAWETIPYTQDEIAGYIFAGMKAANALEKWGGANTARRRAQDFASVLMPENLLKLFGSAAGKTGC